MEEGVQAMKRVIDSHVLYTRALAAGCPREQRKE